MKPRKEIFRNMCFVTKSYATFRTVEDRFNYDCFDELQGPKGRHTDLSHEADWVPPMLGECSMLSAVTRLLPIDSHRNFRAARSTKLFCDRCFARVKKKCVAGPTCSHTAFADEPKLELCALREKKKCMPCVCVFVFVCVCARVCFGLGQTNEHRYTRLIAT